MAKGEPGLADAYALLQILIGAADGDINKPFDLNKLPRKMMEIERKYWLVEEGKSMDWTITNFIWRLMTFFSNQGITIQRLITFVGVDQYYIIQKNGRESVFRYRVGANRPPQLTVKFQTVQGSNEIRGEINLDIRYEEPENVRAFMAVICGLADGFQLFSIQQSGNIWVVNDEKGIMVEIVVYKVASITQPEKIYAFAEIEPLNSENIPGVLVTITRYQNGLKLGKFICKESIAQLFRPAR